MLTNRDFPKVILCMVFWICVVYTKGKFGWYPRQNLCGFKKLLKDASTLICVAAVISGKRELLEAYPNNT